VRVGIIGARNIGGTLARRLTALGHQVAVANSRGPETLADLARVSGARPATVNEAVTGAEVIVIAIPERSIPRLPGSLFDGVAAAVAVVDTGNYYPRERDGLIEPIEDGLTESRWVSNQLGRPVIKAFNNIGATHLLEGGRPPGALDRIALPVAGDDDGAKARVMRLIDELGFDPVDAGGLDESWRQQPGTPVYVADLDAAGTRAALAQARPERDARFSGTPDSPGSFTDPR
jgi:predicted dinucleotide-binding enzyme